MSHPAEDYLAAAHAIVERHALHRDRIDWQALRLACAQRATDASTAAGSGRASDQVSNSVNSRLLPTPASATSLQRGDAGEDLLLLG